MPIISSVVAQVTLNGDGSVRVREEHTDHTGEVWMERYNTPSHTEELVEGVVTMVPVDHTLALAGNASKVLTYMSRAEAVAFESHVLSGNSPETFDRRHNNAAALVKPLLRAFMQIDDPVRALKTARWIRDNLGNTQLDTQVPVAVRQKIRARIANLVSMEAALEADATHIVEVK